MTPVPGMKGVASMALAATWQFLMQSILYSLAPSLLRCRPLVLSSRVWRMQVGRAHHTAALAAAVPAAGGGGLHHPAHRAGPAGAPRPGTRRGSRHMHPGEQCTARVSASVGAKAELGCMRLKAPCATNQATWRASSAPAKEVDVQTDTNKTSVFRAPHLNMRISTT